MARQKKADEQLQFDLPEPTPKDSRKPFGPADEAPLPEGWKWATLGYIADINTRLSHIRELSDELPVTFVPMAAVDAEQGIIAYPEEQPLSKVRKGFTSFVDGDVIFAKITPCMENGKAAIARGLHNGLGFGSTEFHVLRPREFVTSEWLFHYVRQESFRRNAKACFAGTAGQLRVPASFLYSYSIPLPPLPEQQRIVARIEELFSQLDAGVAALRRVQAGLKRYKASVLKAACEGRLSPQDPADEPAAVMLRRLGKEPLEGEGLGELPEGWCWAPTKNLGNVQLGRQRAPKYHNGPYMRPYLRVANVFEDRIDLSDVLQMNFSPEEYEIYKLEYGDILLNEGQSPELLGRPAMYRNEVPGACFQNTLIRFRSSNMLSRQFALIVFRYYLHAGRFTKESKITTNIAHLSAGRFGNIEFPLPPLLEQERIVAEVERRLSLAQEVEAVVAASLQRAGRLRQAVLKAAFEGRYKVNLKIEES